jgi:hypothetical protein
MKRKLKMEWYKGVLNEDARVELAAEIMSSRTTLELLRKLLEDRVAALDATHTKKTNYDSPSWAYAQADYVGAKRTLQEIIELVTTEEEK